MGLKQKMEEESDCIEAIFQSYISLRSTHKIFLFFEGKDDFKYYWCRLSPFIGTQNYEKYVCNNKSNVLRIHDMIYTKTKRKKEEKLCYFVDRDFEKEMPAYPDIYVTPTYSIENLYVSDNAIKNMLKGEWGLSGEMAEEDKRDFDIAFNYLIDKRTEIIESIIYANAWYSLQYNKSKDKPPFPKLTAIKEVHTIKDIRNKEELQNLVTNSVVVSDGEIEEEIQYLMEHPEVRIRGKYFEQTMPHYIRKVFEDSNKRKNRVMFSKRRYVNINVGEDNMISVLSQYADVPEDLMSYIIGKFYVGF